MKKKIIPRESIEKIKYEAVIPALFVGTLIKQLVHENSTEVGSQWIVGTYDADLFGFERIVSKCSKTFRFVEFLKRKIK